MHIIHTYICVSIYVCIFISSHISQQSTACLDRITSSIHYVEDKKSPLEQSTKMISEYQTCTSRDRASKTIQQYC